MKNQVSVMEVELFKSSFCNENQIIIDIILNQLQCEFISPILDIGCGTGDIAYYSLSEKTVVGIDINYANPVQHPLRENHSREKADFFEFSSDLQFNTLFISHTLQFIDNDLNLLNKKLKIFNSKRIIIIANRNDDFMEVLIEWVSRTFKSSSPEIRHDNFPKNYKLIKSVPFTANLVCPSYNELMYQVSYLMLIDIKRNEESILEFLKRNLKKPEFTINQDILIYEKE